MSSSRVTAASRFRPMRPETLHLTLAFLGSV
ncbi:2'-5' RNA ligase family protein, partial [Pontibaca methylaminivorans]